MSSLKNLYRSFRLLLAQAVTACIFVWRRRVRPVPLVGEESMAEVNAILTQLQVDHLGLHDLRPEDGAAACKAQGRQCSAEYARQRFASMAKAVPSLATALVPDAQA